MEADRAESSDPTGDLVKLRLSTFFTQFDVESFVDDNDDTIEIHRSCKQAYFTMYVSL
jgi:hypothetical protein